MALRTEYTFIYIRWDDSQILRVYNFLKVIPEIFNYIFVLCFNFSSINYG